MKFQMIPGIQSLDELRAHVVERGCYSREENERIFRKWFSRSRPRDRVFSYLVEKLGIDQSVMCDVGCGYGANLVYATPGSFGLELEPYQTAFGQSIGLPIQTRNIITDDLSDVPPVDLVWCAATIEHVDAPHVFLRRLYYLLKPGGRLILEVPSALPSRLMRVVPGARHVFGDHDDHVNSFTPSSLSRFCERAGFSEDWIFRYSTPLLNKMPSLPVWLTRIPPLSAVAESIVYVGRQIPGWEYPRKATRRAANNPAGYRFKSMFSSSEDDQEERRH